jgi:predicted nucleic acid-binding protein
MKFIDTSVLTTFILEYTITLTKVEENKLNQFKELSRTEVQIPVFILTELTILIGKVAPKKYSLPKGYCEELCRKLLSEIDRTGQIYYPTEDDLILAKELFLNNSQSLSFQDIFLYACARNNHSKIVTLDRELNNFEAKSHLIK